jgi:hypothetical protein
MPGDDVARARVLAILAVLVAACSNGGLLPTTWTEEQAPWRLEAEPTDSDLLVRAEFGGSSCTRFVRWDVRETDQMVEIDAIVARSSAQECTADLVLERATIGLDAPLGDRVLRGCQPAGGVGDCREVVPHP